ncbi:MAG: beta-ketoacyl-ACP synthase I [Pseudomonadota bacterium]
MTFLLNNDKPRRVVVTGLGIISCIGNSIDEVLASLKAGTSGITADETMKEMGFRSQISGKIDLNLEDHIDKRQLRFMGPGAAYNQLAMEQAIADAGLNESEVSNERTGIIMGSGGPSTSAQIAAADIAREKGPKRVGPFAVPKCMSSTNSANISTNFKIKGVNYSITSACSTSAHCIGNAAEMIAMGKQDVMFAGGGEELDWALSVLFDAMGAMSSKYNDMPEKAARAYDADRDGFVIGSGGGVVVLEDYDRAKARGAKIYAEVTGYGATSDGADMVAPSGEGGMRSMKLAIQNLEKPVTYINTHGTSTPAGDITEINAIKEVFEPLDQNMPHISATKSMTGHSLGATGVQEAIYSILMMQHSFVCPSINIENLDEGAAGMPIAQECIDNVDHQSVMSNSFGFGGTNCTLVMSKVDD